MSTIKSTHVRGGSDRREHDLYEELKRLLEGRRRRIVHEVRDRMHGVRAEREAAGVSGVLDVVESSEADSQEDLEFSLIELKAELLAKIDEALSRLELGMYGYCTDCGEAIAADRLRALPFAVRCCACEEERERTRGHERIPDEASRSFASLADRLR